MSTVFSFLKNIFVQFRLDLRYFYWQVLRAFIGQDAANIPGKSASCLLLPATDDGQDFAVVGEAINSERPTLIFLPFAGFLPAELLSRISTANSEKAICVMTQVEMVIEALDAAMLYVKQPVVVVLGASLVPTKRELERSLFAKARPNLRQRALEDMFVALKRRQQNGRIDVAIVDYPECLGQKNSALLRRMFELK